MHWGATTQDITDTATVLQIRDALALVEADLTALANALAKLAKEHRLTPVIGRSNLQQAIPVTFGYKMAGILSAVQLDGRMVDKPVIERARRIAARGSQNV